MWDTKYRPLRFSDVLGQQGSITILKARLRNGTALDTSYLFGGGHGMGKTTLARIHARAVLCLQLNKEDPEPCNECDNCLSILSENSQAFSERDAASQGTIDHIRRIVDDLPFAVLGAPKRVYLFDECHRMSKDAQDVLLKPLEEKLFVGMFCTTEPEKVRGAIRSRCEEHTIRKVTREEILAWVKRVLDKEQVPHEDDAVLTVIDYTGGHLRDVLNRLEMISQGGDISIDRVRDALGLTVVSSYYDILLRLSGDLAGALSILDDVCGRVTPEEAAAGLSEAAMNAFRLANGMLADFSFTDREQATKLHGLYKDSLIRVAEYFLKSRSAGKIGLVCDVASLSHTLRGGSLAVVTQPQLPVFVPVQVPQTPVPVSAPVTAPTSPTPVPVTAPTPSAPPASPVAAAKPHQEAEVLTQKEALGRLYIPATQSCALTELDDKVIQPVSRKSSPPMALGSSRTDERTPVTPETWRRLFRERHVAVSRKVSG